MSVNRSLKAFSQKFSLTVKIVGVSLVAGLAVLTISNYILTRQVEEAFQNQLFIKLDQQTLEGRERLNKFIKGHYQLANVILAQASFLRHLDEVRQAWRDHPADPHRVITYTRKPAWLPSRTILRTFAQASFYLLLDAQGHVREVYSSRPQNLPAELISPDPFIVQASHNENFMTSMAGTPHILSAADVKDENDRPLATILLATPLNDELLSHLQPSYTANQTAALVTGLKPYVLSSSDPLLIPKNTPLADLKKDYFIFRKLEFNYEYSDLLVAYAHFIAKEEVKKLARPVLLRERIQLVIIAAVFAITFSVAMSWLARRITILSQAMVNFSNKNLGTTSRLKQSGDQISILEHQFEALTKEVLASNRAQADLRQSILQSIPSPIFFQDEENVLLGCNTAFEEFVGKKGQELLGRNITETLSAQFSNILLHYNEELILKGGRKFHEEEINDAQGNQRQLFICKAFFRQDNDNQGRIVATMTDITNLRQAEREKEQLESQLRQAQKMEAIGTLASGIAHDFNNVLTPILGFGELLQRQLPPGHEALPLVEPILQASHRAKDMVQRILAFSRQEEKQKIAVDLKSLIKEVAKLLRTSFPSTIDIQLNLPEREALVLADPTQIHQTIMNIGTNALYAMEKKGGVLTLSLSTIDVDRDQTLTSQALAGKFVKLEITDTGCGIAPAVLERIFEPYFTTKGPGEGSGMGLSVVLGIIQSHHGHIEVESEPQKGSTFTIYLPVLDEQTQEGRDMDHQSEPGELPRGTENIVVIDDEELNALTLQEMLSALGYRAKSFTSSSLALDHCRTSPDIDLIITDRIMPELTGLELAKALRERRQEMPIIICSGDSEGLTEDKLQALKINAVLLKPIATEDLARMVRRVLDEGGA